MSRFAVMDPETGDWVEVTEEGIRLGLSLAAGVTLAPTPPDALCGLCGASRDDPDHGIGGSHAPDALRCECGPICAACGRNRAPTPPDALLEAAQEYIDAIDADLHRPGNRWDAARRDAAMDALRAALETDRLAHICSGWCNHPDVPTVIVTLAYLNKLRAAGVTLAPRPFTLDVQSLRAIAEVMDDFVKQDVEPGLDNIAAWSAALRAALETDHD